MTSLAARMGDHAPSLAAAREAMAEALSVEMGYTGWSWGEAAEARRLAAPAGRPESAGALETTEA
jgi:hypothetical protein